MALLEQIDVDFKEALKKRDSVRVGVLRMLKSALKNKSMEKREELTEEDALAILKSEIKKRKESIEAFSKAERQDLVAKEESDLSVLEPYMPEQLSAEVVKQKVNEILTALPEAQRSQFGPAMGAVMKELNGQVDGQVVGELVKEFLSK